MAIKPTIYKIRIAISDLNREYYDSIHLVIALHPSENLARMMARIVAYCLNVQGDLTLTRGLSMVDEPDIWIKNRDQQIKLWIDMGEPTAERIKKSSRVASEVKIYSFNSKSDTWWGQIKNKVSDFKNVKVYQLQWQQVQALAACAERNMDWSLSISGDTVYVSTDSQACELLVLELL